MTTPWEGWRFHSEEELVQALEEYTAFKGAPKMPLYDGEPGGDADGMTSKWECVMKQNKAIDRAMLRLRHTHGLSHRLLDAYYRGGLCCEANGWERACARAGLPYVHRGKYHRGTFEVLLSAAVEALFVAHCVRPRRCS